MKERKKEERKRERKTQEKKSCKRPYLLICRLKYTIEKMINLKRTIMS